MELIKKWKGLSLKLEEIHIPVYTQLQDKDLITLQKGWKSDQTLAPVTTGKMVTRARIQ